MARSLRFQHAEPLRRAGEGRAVRPQEQHGVRAAGGDVAQAGEQAVGGDLQGHQHQRLIPLDPQHGHPQGAVPLHHGGRAPGGEAEQVVPVLRIQRLDGVHPRGDAPAAQGQHDFQVIRDGGEPPDLVPLAEEILDQHHALVIAQGVVEQDVLHQRLVVADLPAEEAQRLQVALQLPGHVGCVRVGLLDKLRVEIPHAPCVDLHADAVKQQHCRHGDHQQPDKDPLAQGGALLAHGPTPFGMAVTLGQAMNMENLRGTSGECRGAESAHGGRVSPSPSQAPCP